MPMTRMSISISEALKERMDRLEGLINWSGVARHAIERAVADAEKGRSQQEKMKMEQVVERLRATKEETSSEQRQEGDACGRWWAEHHAKAVELERLASYHDSAGYSWEAGLVGEHSAYGPNEHFHMIVANINTPEDRDNWSRSDAADFWDEAIGDEEREKSNDADFVIGFAIGALAVWEEVADQL